MGVLHILLEIRTYLGYSDDIVAAHVASLCGSTEDSLDDEIAFSADKAEHFEIGSAADDSSEQRVSTADDELRAEVSGVAI